MAKCTRKNALSEQLQYVKNHFAQHDSLPFKDILSDEFLTAVAETGDPHDTVYDPLTTLQAFVSQALDADKSCKHAVAYILADRVQRGLKACSISTGGYCLARQRLPLDLLQTGVRQTGKALHRQADATFTWRDFSVVIADGTTAKMPDTEDNQGTFPQSTNQKPGLGFPIVRMVGLISLTSGAIIDYAISRYQGKGTGETSLLSELFDHLSPGDLLLADRYYCTYAIIFLLFAKGVPVVFKQRAGQKIDFRKGKKLGAKDHIISWNKPKRKPVWMTQSDFDQLPETLEIREFCVNGEVFITTLMNAKKYPKKDIYHLYGKRWQIELDFRTIKSDMQMDVLRCKTADMVKKEIAVHMLAYNLTRLTLLQSAKFKNIDPRGISFKAAMQLMAAFKSNFRQSDPLDVTRLYEILLQAIAATAIGKRKRCSQPRAVKMRPKPYPLLTMPRAEAVKSLKNKGF